MIKYYFKKQNKFKSGFTLVETLVAISIFSVSIVALISILANGISNTNYAKKKLIAAYLAQEGVEYVRNIRDTHVLYDPTSAQTGWTSFNTKLTNASCNNATNGCYLGDLLSTAYTNSTQPMISIPLNPCTSSTCANGAMLYDPSTGKYGYSGVASGYSRKITTSAISLNETKVTSTVYWTQGSGTKSIVFSENLFNWVE